MRYLAGCLTVLTLAMGLVTALPARAADLIFHGGPIYTARDDAPTAEAVAVRDSRILAVGGLEAVMAHRTERTDVIDLNGAALFPGFVDGHAHLRGIGEREMTLNLDDVTSIADLKARIAARVEAATPGDVIVGRGWIETHWPEGRFPTRADLDPVSPRNPVFLTRADGHAAVLNSAALDYAGIGPDTEAPFGGEILRDGAGRPTGMLIDDAMDLAREVTARAGDIDSRDAYLAADRVYTARGWTGLHNMSVAPADVPLMESLSESGEMALRVYNSVDRAGADELIESGGRQSANGRIVTRAIKLYMDGALGSRGAALLQPYADAADTDGLMRIRKAEAMAILLPALRAGIQVNTHAIGDRANRLLLDWYAEAFAAVPPADRAIAEPRWRDEHTQIVHPDDIPRFAELGVIPSMQPSHAIGDLHFAPARLGLARLEGAYAWQSLIDSGAIVVAGSDAPVEVGDPVIEFYAAVARKDLTGFSGPGWRPEEAVDRPTALRMLTAWPARAAFAEDERGVIAVGKQADFSVFSEDLMTISESRIPEARAVMTVIGGEIVHRDGA